MKSEGKTMKKRYIGYVVVVLVALTLLITHTAVGEFPDWERMEEEGEYIDVEKDVYDKGETVRIALRNDGNLTRQPMSRYVKIFNIDTDELVYDGGEVDEDLPIIPSEEVMEWDQRGIDGNKVSHGQYHVIFQSQYQADFSIEEERATTLNAVVFISALTGATVYYTYKKKLQCNR